MSLMKLAANAFTKRFVSGALSTGALDKIKKAGMIRSGERILEGFNKGTTNILQRKGIEVQTTGAINKIVAMSGGGYAFGHGNVYHVNDSKLKYLTPLHSVFTPNKNKVSHALAFRHEAHEVAESGIGNLAKIHKPMTDKELQASSTLLSNIKNNKGIRGKLLNLQNPIAQTVKASVEESLPQVINQRVGKAVGNHNNLAVLGREANDVRSLKHIYGLDTSKLEHIRNKVSGEPKLLQRITGKEYGKDAFNKKDLKSLRFAPHDFQISQDMANHSPIYKDLDPKDKLRTVVSGGYLAK